MNQNLNDSLFKQINKFNKKLIILFSAIISTIIVVLNIVSIFSYSSKTLKIIYIVFSSIALIFGIGLSLVSLFFLQKFQNRNVLLIDLVFCIAQILFLIIFILISVVKTNNTIWAVFCWINFAICFIFASLNWYNYLFYINKILYPHKQKVIKVNEDDKMPTIKNKIIEKNETNEL